MTAGLVLVLCTGCGAQGPGILSSTTTTEIPSSPPAATHQASPTPSGQDTGAPVRVTTIPLGRHSGVEAKLPINGYYAAPGMEITFDASTSTGAISKYEWDLDGDGAFDTTTAEPVIKHTYMQEFDGEMILRVSNPIGSTHILKTPVRVSMTPAHQQLAPPENVQVEVLSTVNGVSEIKVTWESSDPAVDSWAVAINGFPAGRVEKTARTVTVTDIQRKEEVLVEILGLTPDGALGLRAGTTLPAAK
ncbi:MAG TPA: PKD domain-containing protein [Arthrobacter sp.]|nr:PKD domain-containing protein [Arthrobacter sp.]